MDRRDELIKEIENEVGIECLLSCEKSGEDILGFILAREDALQKEVDTAKLLLRGWRDIVLRRQIRIGSKT